MRISRASAGARVWGWIPEGKRSRALFLRLEQWASDNFLTWSGRHLPSTEAESRDLRRGGLDIHPPQMFLRNKTRGGRLKLPVPQFPPLHKRENDSARLMELPQDLITE